ncbi:MAG: hypothetical protein IKR51_07105, partial [Oscillospiraceae bacterium]|nr:hypothetical protein [Oscillospiraceae bacterium]
MLKDQPWLLYGWNIRAEYEECLREGRAVAPYKGVVDAFCEMDEDTRRRCEPALQALALAMTREPIAADFPYEEPSEFDAILAAAPC